MEPPGGPDDMASNAKMPKKTARVMLRMMTHVNETLAAEVGKPAAGLCQGRVRYLSSRSGDSRQSALSASSDTGSADLTSGPESTPALAGR